MSRTVEDTNRLEGQCLVLVQEGRGRLAHDLPTDDARRTYQELLDRGVEMTDEPTERPYGIDFGLRDPFGNHVRIAQLAS
jgi:uncharacterized glyoxalase superfamily protein PhnB